MPNTKAAPFQHLALSLSGGGYRAAAFHLGTMSYLNHAQWKGVPLIQQLAVVSTISGGTITGMKYALSLAERQPFPVFYKALYSFLKEDILLGKALETLNNSVPWKGLPRQRNLINAFALIYHEYLLDKKSFGLLLDQTQEGFPEFVFNSTDIEHQLAFRFQKTRDGLIGNGEVNTEAASVREVRLADIVAASSCFPGGFEPLHFHSDFIESEQSTLAQAWAERPAIRLMDGGIVDNQGIESIVLFENRRDDKDTPLIGTWLISDVTRKDVEYPKKAAAAPPAALNYSIRFYNRIAWAVVLMAVASVFFFGQQWLTFLSAALFTVAGIWLVASYFVSHAVAEILEKTVSKGESPSFLRNLNIIRSVPLKYVLAQINTRVVSLGKLPDIFMKRIRDQGFRQLFSDKNWNYRIKTNLIYDLLEHKEISEKLKTYIVQANKMGTTLWFSDPASDTGVSMPDALVVAGQATSCYNLIEYMEDMKKKRFDELTPEDQAALEQLLAECRADFQRFNEKSDWLLTITP